MQLFEGKKYMALFFLNIFTFRNRNYYLGNYIIAVPLYKNINKKVNNNTIFYITKFSI